LAERTDAVGRAADIASGAPPSALLVLRGSEDDVITQEGLTSLGDALMRRYTQAHATERFQYLVIEGLPHNLVDSPADHKLSLQVGSWFNRYQ
jgi:hypothetical protein